MAWYAAQENYQVWENVILVEAGTVAEAFEKARGFAKKGEGEGDGWTSGGRPCRLVFGGLSKLMDVFHAGPEDRIGDGDEITHLKLVVDDRAALDRLIADQDVELLYVGRIDP